MTPLEPAFDTDRMRVGLVFVRTFFGEWDADIHGGEHGDVGHELLSLELADGRRIVYPLAMQCERLTLLSADSGLLSLALLLLPR